MALERRGRQHPVRAVRACSYARSGRSAVQDGALLERQEIRLTTRRREVLTDVLELPNAWFVADDPFSGEAAVDEGHRLLKELKAMRQEVEARMESLREDLRLLREVDEDVATSVEQQPESESPSEGTAPGSTNEEAK